MRSDRKNLGPKNTEPPKKKAVPISNGVKAWHRTVVSIFILLWLALFHYDALRPFGRIVFGVSLPKVPLLFPAASWTMYYKIADYWIRPEIYRSVPSQPEPVKVELEDLIRAPRIGSDPVKRGSLTYALLPAHRQSFCAHLRHRFPESAQFWVAAKGYRELVPVRSEFEELPGSYTC